MSINSENPMRRSERQILDAADFDRIFRHAQYVTIAFQAEDAPYTVPLNFGRIDDTIYIHCAMEGRKRMCLEKNAQVGFCLVADDEVLFAGVPCNCTNRYRSIIGTATARVVEAAPEKIEGLNAIMRQYGAPEGPYPQATLDRTLVVAFDIIHMTGKQSGFSD